MSFLQNPAGHHNLGTIRYKLGRLDQAAAEYRRSIQLRPRSASTHLHLGYALGDAGKTDEAIAAWKQALEIQPGEPLATAAIQDALHAASSCRKRLFRSVPSTHRRMTGSRDEVKLN